MLAKSLVFQGGNWNHLHRLLGLRSGANLMYVGDHMYSDILRSKRTLGWRTVLIVPELDNEMEALQRAEDMQVLPRPPRCLGSTSRANAAAHAPVPFTYLYNKQYYCCAHLIGYRANPCYSNPKATETALLRGRERDGEVTSAQTLGATRGELLCNVAGGRATYKPLDPEIAARRRPAGSAQAEALRRRGRPVNCRVEQTILRNTRGGNRNGYPLYNYMPLYR